MVGLTAVSVHAQTAGGASSAAAPATPASSATTGSAPAAAPADAAASTSGKVAANNSATLDTVVITATRRREPQREVPMQVTVLSSKQLEKEGDQSLRDYLTKQPGVSMNGGGGQGGGAGANSLSIRGVTTGEDIGPTVGVYIDEVPFGSSTVYGGGAQFALDMGLLDLNHLEILKGPQGTLYGAGAMGGLLKYVTNEPDSGRFRGNALFGLGGTEHGGLNHTEAAVVNVPIKEDVAALRVSAFNQQDGGYVNRVGANPEKGVDGATTRGGRASLLLTPTRDLSVRLTATTQQIKRDGTNYVDYNGTTLQPISGDLTQSRQVNEPFDQLIQLYSANVEYNLGWARFNSITAYQTIRTDIDADVTQGYVPIFNAIAGAPLFQSSLYNTSLSTRKLTQEFRLTSPSNRKLEWLAGLFYTHEDSHNAQSLTAYGNGFSQSMLTASLPSTYQEFAAYGDLTYHFTSRLSGTAGVRVAHNRQTFVDNLGGVLAPTQHQPGESSDSSTTYLASLSYLLTPNSSLYARIATGYSPGGPQPVYQDPVTGGLTPATFRPESLRSYEVGYKADLWDKRASVNLSAFDIEWSNIQLHNVVDGLGFVTNGGKARSRGLEFVGNLNPTRNWSFGLAATYTDARLTQDVAGLGAFSGDRLPNTPTWAVAASVDYLFNLASYKAWVGATESYTGERNSGFNRSSSEPNVSLPGYATTDLRAGIDLRKASVSFFVHNLFNRRGWLGAYTNLFTLGGPVQISTIQPFTVGMQVNVPF